MHECPIIELVGVPGCGKSTTIRNVIEKLTGSGIKVLFINDLFVSKPELIKGAVQGIIRYSNDTQRERDAWKQFVAGIKEVPLRIKTKIDWFERLQFLYCYNLIAKINSDYNFILSDQWIFQHALSVLHDKPIKEHVEAIQRLDFEVYQLFSNQYHVILCDLTIEENVNRIQNRKHGQSVLDGMDIESLRAICSRQINNTKYFSNEYLKTKCSCVDFNGTPHENTEHVLRIIEKECEVRQK